MGTCDIYSGEIRFDSLNVHLNDLVSNNCIYPYTAYRCVDTNGILAFYGYGTATLRRTYVFGKYLQGNLCYFSRGSGWEYGEQTLKGAVINGNVSGDTSFPVFTGLNNQYTEIPYEFKLSQNFPNPFNPATNITFQIAAASQVRLTVYNVMGKEVENIINKLMGPGKYYSIWDASAFPSGVYYYRLQAGSYTETKKMVLIK